MHTGAIYGRSEVNGVLAGHAAILDEIEKKVGYANTRSGMVGKVHCLAVLLKLWCSGDGLN